MPWSVEGNFEIIATAASLAGVVHIGTIGLSAFPALGISVDQLIQQATQRIDIKEGGGRVFTLRSAVENEVLLHEAVATTVVDGLADESFTYAIIENACYTAGAVPAPFNVRANFDAQALWWPDGTQPALKGLSSSTQQSVGAEPSYPEQILRKNLTTLESLRAYPSVPVNWPHIVNAVLNRQDISQLVEVTERMVSMGGGLGTGGQSSRLFSSPLPGMSYFTGSPAISDDTIYLNWSENKDQCVLNFRYWSPEALSLFDDYNSKRGDLIDLLSSETERREAFKTRVQASQQRVIHKHGRALIEYYEGDNLIDFISESRDWPVFDQDEFHLDESEPELSWRRPPQSQTSEIPVQALRRPK
jgi:hypothetical protein